MGQQRYTPECKDEAVRQFTERGHSVQGVAARLGVSTGQGSSGDASGLEEKGRSVVRQRGRDARGLAGAGRGDDDGGAVGADGLDDSVEVGVDGEGGEHAGRV